MFTRNLNVSRSKNYYFLVCMHVLQINTHGIFSKQTKKIKLKLHRFHEPLCGTFVAQSFETCLTYPENL